MPSTAGLLQLNRLAVTCEVLPSSRPRSLKLLVYRTWIGRGASLKPMMALQEAAEAYPKPPDLSIGYGTAGFRAEASVLPSTVFRSGVLAALRSRKTDAVTGLVITASHNPAADNGVKVADPDGGMLTMDWEAAATTLANAPSSEALVQAVEHFAAEEGIPPQAPTGKVLLAWDTRRSGPSLAEAAARGVAATGATVVDLGVLTTPQLHWMVRATNRGEPADEESYFRTLSQGFRDLVGLVTSPHQTPLAVDCADGVGALKLPQLNAHLHDSRFAFDVRNEGAGQLNERCGADFVQKEQQPPRGISAYDLKERGGASLDGDADRLVFFYTDSGGHFQLLDGDKIAALAASFVGEQLTVLGKEGERWKVGVVQTAYANGASTQYLKEHLRLEVALTSTGVKHLHERAVRYDVGIYWEANGHGTMLFSPTFSTWLHHQEAEEGSPRTGALRRLLALEQVMNQAVGDALSGLLLVEGVLAAHGWSLQHWHGLYTDRPSRQLKVKVRDRSVITTSHAETRVVTPPGLQETIERCVACIPQGRAFVRPSGTEDVVRVYAEAATQEQAIDLAQQVARLVHQQAGGLGPPP